MPTNAKKSPYLIEGLTTLRNRGMGHYGIKITIDNSVAKRLLKTPRVRCLMIDDLKAELANKYARIEFVEESWLLQLIMLEGSTCSCFGVGHSVEKRIESGDDIAWTSHNIDSPEQAAKLVAIWLHWFNSITSAFGILEHPFSM